MNKKDMFFEKMKNKLDQWSADIDKLQDKVDEMETGLKVEYQELVRDLNTMRSAARERLTELEESSSDAWTELQEGIEASWDELEQSLQESKKKFNQ